MDVFSEQNQLEENEKDRMQEIQEELETIWHMEETKAKQRSRDRHIKEGDKNIAYFQAIFNQKRRKKSIAALHGDNDLVTNNKNMLKLVVEFYKKLFAHEEKLDIHLDSSFWEVEDLITEEENDILVAPFSEEEIREAIFGSYADGAPGPDGFPFLFYQKFWTVIKYDFMKLVRKFESGDLDINRLNYVILTLLPKEPDATDL